MASTLKTDDTISVASSTQWTALSSTTLTASSLPKSNGSVFSPRLVTKFKPTIPFYDLPSPFEKVERVPSDRFRYKVVTIPIPTEEELGAEIYCMYGQLRKHLQVQPGMQSSWEAAFKQCKIDIFQPGLGLELTLDIIYPKNAPYVHALRHFQPIVQGKQARVIGDGYETCYVPIAASIDPSLSIKEFIRLLEDELKRRPGCSEVRVVDVWALDLPADEWIKIDRFSGKLRILIQGPSGRTSNENFWAWKLPGCLKLSDLGREIWLTHPY